MWKTDSLKAFEKYTEWRNSTKYIRRKWRLPKIITLKGGG